MEQEFPDDPALPNLKFIYNSAVIEIFSHFPCHNWRSSPYYLILYLHLKQHDMQGQKGAHYAPIILYYSDGFYVDTSPGSPGKPNDTRKK